MWRLYGMLVASGSRSSQSSLLNKLLLWKVAHLHTSAEPPIELPATTLPANTCSTRFGSGIADWRKMRWLAYSQFSAC
jgi:hypothetical protein